MHMAHARASTCPHPAHLLVVLEEAADLREAVRRQLADVVEVLELGVVRVHGDDLGGSNVCVCVCVCVCVFVGGGDGAQV